MVRNDIYKSIVDHMKRAVYVCGPGNRILYMNPAAERLTGLTSEKARGMACHKLFSDAGQMCQADCSVDDTGSAKDNHFQYEGNLKTADGQSVPFRASISTFNEGNGRVAGIIELLENANSSHTESAESTALNALKNEIKERLKAEDALWKSEERYRALSDATFEAIFISENGICIETNQRATEMFGYAYDELIGIFGTDVIAAESKELVKHNMLSGYEAPYEVVACRKNGSTFHAEIRGKMMEYKGRKVRVTVVHDIDKRKRAEEASRQSEKTLKAILAASPAGIGLVRNRVLGWANNAMYHMIGYPPGSLLGKNVRVLYPDDDIFARANRELYHGMKETGTGETETHWVKQDGSIIRCYLQSSPLDPTDPEKGVIAAAINITDQKQAEEHIHSLTHQLMKTQENERRIISRELHDSVAQDLSTAKIYCDLLIDHPLKSTYPEIRDRISDISAALQNSIRTIRNMAYYLRPACLDDMGIVEAVSQYCSDFSRNSALKINFRAIGMENLRLDFDTEINLYRLIQEGLNNVKKHAEAQQSTIRLLAAFPWIILRIEDDGQGFNLKQRMAVAQQEKRMGLRSMEERVDLLGGKMKIYSRISGGTKIFIEVPYRTINDGNVFEN
jgi:PAS domain S-box-containing protein